MNETARGGEQSTRYRTSKCVDSPRKRRTNMPGQHQVKQATGVTRPFKKRPCKKKAVVPVEKGDTLVQKDHPQGSTHSSSSSVSHCQEAMPEDSENSKRGKPGPEIMMDRKRRAPAEFGAGGDNGDHGDDEREHSRPRLDTESHSDKWTEAMHRCMAEAIYEAGLKHASPAVIMEKMTETPAALTSERVKSHLQKYRNNKEKSKADFLSEFDSWLRKAVTIGCMQSGSNSPASVLGVMGTEKLLGGELAAFLSYSVMQEEGCFEGSQSSKAAVLDGCYSTHFSPASLRNRSLEYADRYSGARVPFPILTEEEKCSPLGEAISQVLGLFYPMTQCLMQDRLKREKASSATASTDAHPQVNVDIQVDEGVQQQQQQQAPQTHHQPRYYRQMSSASDMGSGQAFPWMNNPAMQQPTVPQYPLRHLGRPLDDYHSSIEERATSEQYNQQQQQQQQSYQPRLEDVYRYQAGMNPFHTDSIVHPPEEEEEEDPGAV